MELITKYFADLTETQLQQFSQLLPLYEEWNAKINVISRKDMENLYERHVLHSLALAAYTEFLPDSQIVDAGTGGGFPGIPLAIFYPEVKFHLVDSIGKKIKVVEGVVEALGLANVTFEQNRVENLKTKFDYAISRAVAPVSDLYRWLKPLIAKENRHELKNGIICLKGGDLTEELNAFKRHFRVESLEEYFEEPFFETKKIVFIPV